MIRRTVFILMLCIGAYSTKILILDDLYLDFKAKNLAESLIIVDGHIDLPYRLNQLIQNQKPIDGLILESSTGEFDVARAKKGGLNAPFMSIYIPATFQKSPGASKAMALELIKMIKGLVEKHPTKVQIARNPNDIKDHYKKGLISFALGIENGSAIEDKLDNIDLFYKLGVRYITLTHSKDNLICDSSYDDKQTWKGLSPFGKNVVERMNKLGMMIDISHLSDAATRQVLLLSKAPVIASHSSLRTFVPGFQRNLSNELLHLLKKNQGIIMINFGSNFISKASQDSNNIIKNKLESYKKNNPNASKKTLDTYNLELKKTHYRFASIEEVADHIDKVVEEIGIDYVGLGSDFDGVGDTLPVGLKDVSTYPNLIKELLKRGYSEQEIEKICSTNILRVWRTVNETSTF